MVRKLTINNGRYNMALLDFMKEGFNSLQSQPKMYDPHANARRLMGGPVQEQQGGGFNFFGGNNISQNAQEPLPQMDVTGQVGGPNMTPYQTQEIGPSHLGVTNIDRTNTSNPELPGAGTYNQYYGEHEQIWNPQTLKYEPAIRGARKDIYSNPEATYTAEQMPTSMQSDGSVAQIGMDDLNKQSVPAYNTDSNMVWSEELQRYVPVTENNAVQQPTGYNPNANMRTDIYNHNLLGRPDELEGPTQPNGGGATPADNNAEAAATQLSEERKKELELINAKAYDPYYVDYGGYFGGKGMSFTGDDYEVTDYDKKGYGKNSILYRNSEYAGSGNGPDFNQFDKTKDFVGPNAGGFTDYPGKISNFIRNILNTTGTGTEDRNFAGGEEVKIDYDPDNQSDYNLQKDREIVNQIMSEDVTDEERRQLFEAYGIDPYEYLTQGLISKK